MKVEQFQSHKNLKPFTWCLYATMHKKVMGIFMKQIEQFHSYPWFGKAKNEDTNFCADHEMNLYVSSTWYTVKTVVSICLIFFRNPIMLRKVTDTKMFKYSISTDCMQHIVLSGQSILPSYIEIQPCTRRFGPDMIQTDIHSYRQQINICTPPPRHKKKKNIGKAYGCSPNRALPNDDKHWGYGTLRFKVWERKIIHSSLNRRTI